MKKRYLISVVCFLLPLAFVLVFGLIERDRTFSETENRELATVPELTWQSYADSSFMQKLETYFNDQFPFRDGFIRISKAYNKFMYPSFLLSDDDVISLPPASVNPAVPPIQTAPSTGGSEESPGETTAPAAPQTLLGNLIYRGRIMETFNVSDAAVQRYADIVNRIYTACGNPETYVLIPTPAYTLYAPDGHIAENTDFNRAIDAISAALKGPKLIDLRDTYAAVKDEYIYFRTDHHWTARGAYYACKEFLQVAEGVTLPDLSTYRGGVREGFLGSLYRAVMTNQASALLEKEPDRVEYFYPNTEAKVVAYSSAAMNDPQVRQVIYPDYNDDTNLYCVYMGGDIAIGKITTQNKNGKSILVIRDSYGHAFIPFLLDAYETVYTFEPRYFDPNLNPIDFPAFFAEQKIDKILYVGYPHMSVGGYWDCIAKYLEPILPAEK